MNERIKQLIKQATVPGYMLGESYVQSRLDEQKFAELIVKECAWAADFADGEPGDYILKHFGVEEIMEDQPDEIEYCPTCGEEWSGTSCGALRCGWIEGNEE